MQPTGSLLAVNRTVMLTCAQLTGHVVSTQKLLPLPILSLPLSPDPFAVQNLVGHHGAHFEWAHCGETKKRLKVPRVTKHSQ